MTNEYQIAKIDSITVTNKRVIYEGSETPMSEIESVELGGFWSGMTSRKPILLHLKNGEAIKIFTSYVGCLMKQPQVVSAIQMAIINYRQ